MSAWTYASASTLLAALVCASSAAAETHRGITITPESRCTPYHPDDYPYPQSAEAQIVAELGGAIYDLQPIHRHLLPQHPRHGH